MYWTLQNHATIHNQQWATRILLQQSMTTHDQPQFHWHYPHPPQQTIILPPAPITTHDLVLFHHQYPWSTTLLKNEVFQSYFSMTLHILIENVFQMHFFRNSRLWHKAQALRHGLWGPCPCYDPCKSRKRELGQMMKSRP